MAAIGDVIGYSFTAASSFASKKWFAVKIDGTGKADLAGVGDKCVGIMIDEPTTGLNGSVCFYGPAWAKAGAAINAGDFLKSDAAGKFIPVTADKDFYVGMALEDAVLDDEVKVIVAPGYFAV